MQGTIVPPNKTSKNTMYVTHSLSHARTRTHALENTHRSRSTTIFTHEPNLHPHQYTPTHTYSLSLLTPAHTQCQTRYKAPLPHPVFPLHQTHTKKRSMMVTTSLPAAPFRSRCNAMQCNANAMLCLVADDECRSKFQKTHNTIIQRKTHAAAPSSSFPPAPSSSSRRQDSPPFPLLSWVAAHHRHHPPHSPRHVQRSSTTKHFSVGSSWDFPQHLHQHSPTQQPHHHQ